MHYAQEIFEGLKAYRQDSGPIVAFRPQANAARFHRSAVRMAMPELPEDAFVPAIELLVTQDKDWVPAQEGQSLYLRPFMIATDPALGIGRRSATFLFPLIASPAGQRLQRRHPGGLGLAGRAATPGPPPAAPGRPRPAATTPRRSSASMQALDNGCDQVVWLDALEHRWVEEMGGMNLFFVYGSGPMRGS